MLCFKVIYQYLGAKSSFSLLLLKTFTRLVSKHISHPLDKNTTAKLQKVKYVYLSLQDEGFESWVKLQKNFCH